jgi:hypothetical protein
VKYEVVRLNNGDEFVGMVKDVEDTLEITLPMICHLTKVSQRETLATFIPYSPLSSDSILYLDMKNVLHRSEMNAQFIPFYDEASVKWLTMVEEGNIPLSNKTVTIDTKDYLKKTLDSILKDSQQGSEPLYEVTAEDIRLFEEAVREDEFMNSFTSPKDPKKIH